MFKFTQRFKSTPLSLLLLHKNWFIVLKLDILVKKTITKFRLSIKAVKFNVWFFKSEINNNIIKLKSNKLTVSYGVYIDIVGTTCISHSNLFILGFLDIGDFSLKS